MNMLSIKTRKNILVFFVGPLALIPAVLIATLILLFFNAGEDFLEGFASGLVVLFYGLVFIAYPATLILGIPAIIILEKTNKYGLVPLLIIGLLGAILITAMSAPSVVVLVAYSYCAISVSLGCWYANKCFSAKL